MTTLISRFFLGAAVAAIVFEAAEAQAQLVRIGLGRGVAVNAPGAAVRVGPIGIPGVAYGLPRRPLAAYGVAPVYGVPGVIIARRQARLDAAAADAAALAAAAASGVAAANVHGGAVVALPTAAELAAMPDGVLLDTLVGVMGQLDEDLARFTTAASWRGYLRLPEDALPPPVNGHVELGFQSIAETLGRFDSIAAEPRFMQIAGVPSFGAARQVLAEVVRRFGNEAPVEQENAAPPFRPSAAPASGNIQGESLPTPPPTLSAPTNAGVVERSVLKN